MAYRDNKKIKVDELHKNPNELCKICHLVWKSLFSFHSVPGKGQAKVIIHIIILVLVLTSQSSHLAALPCWLYPTFSTILLPSINCKLIEFKISFCILYYMIDVSMKLWFIKGEGLVIDNLVINKAYRWRNQARTKEILDIHL